MTKSIIIFLLALSTFQLFGQDNRPQQPIPPFSYESENVVFKNIFDSVKLAGTLTYPKKGSNFPAVILISGSGPQDRNSEIFGHQPFNVIADYLTKKGIAVLRVDDRGFGESEGEYASSSLDDFKQDTEYAIDFLKTRKEIDPDKIGLIGHSLGGVIAPMIAAESSSVDFIILLAGTGIRGDKLMLAQKALMERKMSLPEAAITAGQKNIQGAYDIILQSDMPQDSLVVRLKSYFASVFGASLPESQIEVLAKQLSMPWLADFIKYDPSINLKNVTCPVLALNGSNDLQVPAKENLEAIKTHIEENGNTAVTVTELPGLNHLFQKSETGLPGEYGTIEETFSPKVLKIMYSWMKKVALK